VNTVTVYTDEDNKNVQYEVTEDSKAVWGYDEQTRSVHITMEYIVGKRENE
jgi:hypothetical protein